MSIDRRPFNFATIKPGLADGSLTVVELIRDVYRRIDKDKETHATAWISLRDEADALALAQTMDRSESKLSPLFGLPFAVKDNIDVAGFETTAACPGFAYAPATSAHVVARLEAAGAICIGKTNLDQFATGLNGTRTPYGACGSAIDPRFISGGSSSGSAVVVGRNQVAFSLGTDTGGSGRVPAALNNIIGLKPTLGTLSTIGLVPNCRTLDCPTVFALDVADALLVAKACFDPSVQDPSLRSDLGSADFSIAVAPGAPRIGVPREDQLEFFGNAEGSALFGRTLARARSAGAQITAIDFSPFVAAGQMMFEGPWIAERMAAFGDFATKHPEEVLPVVRALIAKSANWSAVDTFQAIYRLRILQQQASETLSECDAIMVPTVASLYTIGEMQADPVALNNNNGHYTYCANMLDLSALSVPAEFYAIGMPFGVTLMGKSFAEPQLAGIALKLFPHTRHRLGLARNEG